MDPKQPGNDGAVVGRRRGSAAAAAAASAAAQVKRTAADGQQAGASGNWDVQGFAQIVPLEEGLHAITVGSIAATGDATSGLALPATAVSVAPVNDQAAVQIVLSSGNGSAWFGSEGGTVVAKAPPGGGFVVVTSYGIPETRPLPQLRVLRVDALDATPRAALPMPPDHPPRELQLEMTTHIEREGDRRQVALGWVGTPGKRARMEAFGVRPLEAISPSDIEYMAFGPASRRTPWVTDAKLCGTRGRGLPLTGFAVRLAPALRERFDVVYEGSFFSCGIIGPNRNGEPCVSLIADDPLEAIRLRVINHAA